MCGRVIGLVEVGAWAYDTENLSWNVHFHGFTVLLSCKTILRRDSAGPGLSILVLLLVARNAGKSVFYLPLALPI